MRIKLRSLYLFAYQDNTNIGFSSSLTLKGKNNNQAIIRDNWVDTAR